MNELENTSVEETAQENKPEIKTYTMEEVNQMINKEKGSALAKQKKEYEKKISLSGLDEASRTQAEKDNRIQELEEQLKEFQIVQNKNEIIKTLSARSLSPQFADLIAIDDDIEAAQKRIESLDALFKKSVQEEVKRRLASPSPKVGVVDGDVTLDNFRKMSLKQRQDLYTSNPDLYKKLTGK